MRLFAFILLLSVFPSGLQARHHDTVRVKKAIQEDTTYIYAAFGKITGNGSMTAQEIAATDSLTISPGWIWEVVSYSITMVSKGNLYSFRMNSAQVTAEAKKICAGLQQGDKFFVDEIQVRHRKTRETRRLPAITVKVN